MQRLCVYCGSSSGGGAAYAAAATALGTTLGRRGIDLVYGGASVGLMGAVADAAIGAGSAVTGVIPRTLQERELAHPRVTELHVVDSMHRRKAMMAELSDAFVALPGGLGTLEELFEILTWVQLGFHAKPVGVLNVAGYYDGLLGFLDHAVDIGFIRAEHRQFLISDDDPARLLERLETSRPAPQPKWLHDRSEL